MCTPEKRSFKNPTAPRMPPISRALLYGTMLAAAAFVVWLGWTGRQLRDEARGAALHEVRVAELRGTIAYLDEWMTMSTRMAAATGDQRWVDRYEEAVPKLDAAIEEAAGLAAPRNREALSSTMGEAHRDLVTMERRALALAVAGDLASAQSLLGGPEFAYLEDVHASGMEVFGQEISAFSEARADLLANRAWLEATGLALAVMILVAASLWLRGRARLDRARRRTAKAARTDALTGLPNRKRFYELAEIVFAEPAAQGHAILLLDLDRFKFVNDAHGHPAGDEVLKLAADRLRGVTREGDLIARLGGDELALVLGHARGFAPSEHEVNAIAARIVAIFANPFALGDGTSIQIGASVGIARINGAGASLVDLMHRADVALSRAKADGRNCFRAFEAGMDAEVRSRALLESDLRQAVADDAIVPFYQPLVDLGTGLPVGVEMLARWPHPTRGMVPPDAFIPLAEELGLIGNLTEHLLLRACRDIADWPPNIMLACNLSPLQLRDPGLPQAIRDVLATTGLPALRLELEVTESALVGDLDLARRSLAQLKALGVRLALDDFGTGYSSLRHLQTLPFDKIKIDRSFIAAMADDAESGKIVSAVVGLGHSLGLVTVAEGIETEEIAGLLRKLGCDIGQGWFYGRPGPADKIAAFIDDARAQRHAEAVAA